MDMDFVTRVWEERVQGKYVFRGMDESDLVFPLDPSRDPHEVHKSLIIRFLDILDRLLESGLQFGVSETHFGKEYTHDPVDLSRWTRRDLVRVGIDFTSSQQAATEYADCWQGSQMKQNLRSLSQHLIDRRLKLSQTYGVTPDEWECVEDITVWMKTDRAARPVVLHVAADSDLFAESLQLLPLGSKEGFGRRVAEHFGGASGVDRSELMSALPDESDDFICAIDKELVEEDVARVEHC